MVLHRYHDNCISHHVSMGGYQARERSIHQGVGGEWWISLRCMCWMKSRTLSWPHLQMPPPQPSLHLVVGQPPKMVPINGKEVAWSHPQGIIGWLGATPSEDGHVEGHNDSQLKVQAMCFWVLQVSRAYMLVNLKWDASMLGKSLVLRPRCHPCF